MLFLILGIAHSRRQGFLQTQWRSMRRRNSRPKEQGTKSEIREKVGERPTCDGAKGRDSLRGHFPAHAGT